MRLSVVRVERARSRALVLVSLACAAVAFVPAIACAAVSTPPHVSSGTTLTAPNGLAVTAGDMVNQLSWIPVSASGVGYRVERAASPSGPWTIVVSRTSATTFSDRVTVTGSTCYRVTTVGKGKSVSAPSAAVANTSVDMSSVVTTSTATLRAANGELTLSFDAGTFTAPATVTVRQVGAPAALPGVGVTPAYDFGATGPLALPAHVTMRYRVPIEQFQVAATLARAIDLATWDVAKGAWVTVPTTVDTSAQVLSADMPHFSYWQAEAIHPHGTSPSKTSYCTGVCHDLLAAPGSPIVLSSRDSAVCYNCHGNMSSTLTTGAGDPWDANVQAQFFACPGQTFDPASQSMHPVAAPGSTSGLACVQCHDPHADPAVSPGLLRSYDPITGQAVTGAKGGAYCGSCHGRRLNADADAVVPGYWERTGGDRTSRFATSAHATVGGTSVARVGCLDCHAPHSSVNTSTTVTCTGGGGGACHSSSANSAGGADIFGAITSGPDDTSHHDLTSAAQARTGAQIACTSCHDPHADSVTSKYVDPDSRAATMTSDVGRFVDPAGSVYVLVASQHDGVAPVISSANVDVSAGPMLPVFTWTTDELATTWLDWGTTTSYELGSLGAASPLTTDHSVAPTGLGDFVYHYRLRAADALNNERVSPDYVYMPTAMPSTVPTPTYPAGLYETTTHLHFGFTWDPVTIPSGAAPEYQVEVYRYSVSGWVLYDSSPWVAGSSWTSAAPYGYGSSLYWRVHARNSVYTNLVGPWSSTLAFNIDYPAFAAVTTSANAWVATWGGSRTGPAADTLAVASLPAPQGALYSVDTDQMALDVRSRNRASIALPVASAWWSAGSSVATPTPTSPGSAATPAQIAAASSVDGSYWRTDATTVDRQWNWQVYRFDLGSARAGAGELSLRWSGHGEPTAGYPTNLLAWDNTLKGWVPLGGGTGLGADTLLSANPTTVSDSFCLRCHDGVLPQGVAMRSGVTTISPVWGSAAPSDVHGPRAGTGAGVSSGGLAGGWQRGGRVACSVCHDPHGSSAVFGLATWIDGVDTSATAVPSRVRAACAACHTGGASAWHAGCIACHTSDGTLVNHSPNVDLSDTANCLDCHRHGSLTKWGTVGIVGAPGCTRPGHDRGCHTFSTTF